MSERKYPHYRIKASDWESRSVVLMVQNHKKGPTFLAGRFMSISAAMNFIEADLPNRIGQRKSAENE